MSDRGEITGIWFDELTDREFAAAVARIAQDLAVARKAKAEEAKEQRA